MSSPHAGWYPDPESPNHLRYWDGEAWSGEVVLAHQGRVRLQATPDGESTAPPLFRVFAEVIDAATLVPVILLLGWPFLQRISDANWGDLASQVGDAGTVGAATSTTSTTGSVLGVLLVGLVVTVGYRALLWRWKQATLGQLALGLRVRPWDHDGPLSWRQALIRAGSQFGFLPLFAVPVAGWLALLWPAADAAWALRDERGQTLHDHLAGTCVVGGPEDESAELEDEGGAPDSEI